MWEGRQSSPGERGPEEKAAKEDPTYSILQKEIQLLNAPFNASPEGEGQEKKDQRAEHFREFQVLKARLKVERCGDQVAGYQGRKKKTTKPSRVVNQTLPHQGLY